MEKNWNQKPELDDSIFLTSHELGMDLGRMDGLPTQSQPNPYIEMVLSEIRGEAHESVTKKLESDLDKYLNALVLIQKQIQLKFTALKGEMDLATAKGLERGRKGSRQFYKDRVRKKPKYRIFKRGWFPNYKA